MPRSVLVLRNPHDKFFCWKLIFPNKKILRFANKQKLEQNILLFSIWLRRWRNGSGKFSWDSWRAFPCPCPLSVQVPSAKPIQQNVPRPEALLKPPKHFSRDSLYRLCHQRNKLQQKMIRHAEGSQAFHCGSCLHLQDKRSQHWHKYWLNHCSLKEIMVLRENKCTWPEELVT